MPLSGDAFRGICDHVFWSNSSPRENASFRHGDIVFCKIDEVWRLFRALRRTRKRVILVTGEGSKPVTTRLWLRRPPHVAAWFGTNMFAAGKSAHHLPLGLGNAGSDTTLQHGEIRDALAGSESRDELLYANFSRGTNPELRGPLWDWLSGPGCSWATTAGHAGSSGKRRYLAEIVRHRFVLCPPGTGEDTHRFWESRYAGCIPVIRSSPAMNPFAALLPVVVVPDFRDLSPGLLRTFTPSRAASPGSLAALWLPFWEELIRREQSAIGKSRGLPIVLFCAAWLREMLAVVREKIGK